MNFPKSTHQQRVEEFMVKAEQDLPDRPTEITEEVRLLRAKLIFEEAMETIREGLGVELFDGQDLTLPYRPDFVISGPLDLVETIDGCCDLMVVTTGTLSACGIPDLMFQEEVDQNNLDKFGPGGSKNKDGKWIKPPSHQPPKIKELLDQLKS